MTHQRRSCWAGLGLLVREFLPNQGRLNAAGWCESCFGSLCEDRNDELTLFLTVSPVMLCGGLTDVGLRMLCWFGDVWCGASCNDRNRGQEETCF